MADTDTPLSVQQLKRESEQTRAGLTTTVEQLKSSVAETASDIRHRISPEAIKAEVSEYIRTRGENLVSAARQNPLQAVAVAATIAYPVLKIARSVPFPAFLVCAGLFLSGSRGQAATQKASAMAANLSDEVVRRARGVGDQIQGIKERALSAVTPDQADSPRNEGLRVADATASPAQDRAARATAAARAAANSVADAGIGAVGSLKTQAFEASDRAGKAIIQTIEQNPFLMAGVGLVVGGFVANALPNSELEEEWVGGTSSAAKRQVQAAVSRGIQTAKSAIGEIYDDASRQAEAEGLSQETIVKAAQDIGRRAQRVAEASTTAFKSPEEDHQTSSTRGDNIHG